MRKSLFATLATLAAVVAGVGEVRGAIVSNAALVLDVNPNGSINDVYSPGLQYYNVGWPTVGYGVLLDGTTFARNNANIGLNGISASFAVSGPGSISGTGSIGSLSFSRTYSLSGNKVNISTRFTNTDDVNNLDLLWYDEADPDQGFFTSPNIPDTVNDIYQNDLLVNVAEATSLETGDYVRWYDNSNQGVLSFIAGDLEIANDTQLLALLGLPYDPDLALQDIGMAIMYHLVLAPGESQTVSFSHEYKVNLTSVPEPASLAIFGCGALGLAFIRRRRSA